MALSCVSDVIIREWPLNLVHLDNCCGGDVNDFHRSLLGMWSFKSVVVYVNLARGNSSVCAC